MSIWKAEQGRLTSDDAMPITPEAEAIFGSQGFSVSLANQWYRSALILAPEKERRQTRIAAEQPTDLERMEHFVRTLNRWLPSNQARMLWVDHWQTWQYGGFENALVAAAWRGLGDTRSPDEAPGLFLESRRWDEQDQTEILPPQAEALGVLSGVITIITLTHSDGWLVSTGSADRIEFWEGHFFFHSADRKQLARAQEIIDEFGCVRWKT